MMLAMAAMMCTVTSCDKDNDEDQPGAAGGKKGWFKAEGKTTDFKYGYLLDFGSSYDDDEVEVMFATYNLLEFYKNPKSFKGKKISSAAFWKDSYGKGFDAMIDAKIKDVYVGEDGDWEGEVEGGKGYYNDELKNFSFDLNNSYYNITGSNLKAYCFTIDKNGDEVELDKTVNVDFEFSGDTENIVLGYDDFEDYSTRSGVIVRITDPKVAKFIRSFGPERRK